MDALNRNELEALRVLWDRGELKPTEIQVAFPHAIDNGTLRSVLKVLMDKGYVSRRRIGKAYHYKAKHERESVLRLMARRMADVFSGGSTADLIARLIKTENLSAEELAELRRAAQTDRTPGRKKRKR